MLEREEHAVLRDLLAPSSERLSRTLELVVKVAIVVVVSMTFQIPDPGISAIFVFFVSKEDSGRSILLSVLLIVAVAIMIAVVFALMAPSLNNPSLRILIIAATSFVMFFLGKASKLEPLASVLGIILAYGFNGEQNAPVGEIATRGLLYAALLVTFPIAVNIAFNIAFGRHPERLLRSALARRLAVSSDTLLAPDGDDARRLVTLVSRGNSELSAELKMVSLFRRLPQETVARLDALIQLTYALLLAVAARGPGILVPDQQALADRLHHLSEAIRHLPDTIDSPKPADLRAEPIEQSQLEASQVEPNQVEMLASMLEDVVRGAPVAGDLPKPAMEPKGGFFKPDAFSNPDYERFAAKATAAVMICYLTFNILDWPGIATCMVTCFLVALSTVGESMQKMRLRLVGCTFGAVIGYVAIVFVLPMTTEITGLLLLVAVITLPAAWITFGSPRVSYAGVQIALAAYLCVLQGTEPKFDLTIARDRFIGILFGNLTVFIIFTRVYAPSLLPRLSQDLKRILDRCRQVLQSIADAEPLTKVGEQIAGIEALVQDMDGEILAFGFEKRPTRFGRLHLLACRLIGRAVQNVVADIARLSARPIAGGESAARDARRAQCAAADRRLQRLAAAMDDGTSLVADGATAGPTPAPDFRRLHRHLDSLTVAAARYRRVLRKDTERVNA